MLAQTKLICSKLLQETSKGPQLPLPVSLAIEIWSHIQILSITLLPLVLQSYDKSQDQLSWALNKLFSYIQPLNVYNPLNHKSAAIPVMSLCFLYFIVFIGLLAFTALQIHARQQIKPFITKILNFAMLFHSKVVFCLLHYFFVKTIDINTSCWASSSLYYCNTEWIIMPILLLILNITLAFFKEAFCFQIHQINDTFGIKTNVQNLLILLQKFLPILLFYLISNSDNVVILTNLICLGLILFVLHKRLPFYNISVMKLNIIFLTIAFWTSLIGLARLFNTEKNLFIFMCVTMALAVKVSMIRLNQRFCGILNLKATADIYEAVHLPVLVEDHMRRMSIFPIGDKINKATLYSLGIIASKIDQIFDFKGCDKIELQELTDEFRKQTYLVVIKEMLDVLKRQPKSELLAICIAQIYIKEFGDAFQTMSLINKLRGRKLSLAANLSLEAISRDLSIIHQASSNQSSSSSSEEEKTSHLVYFSYKHKTKVLKRYVKVEIEKHLRLWRTLSHNNIDTMAVVREAEKISAQSRIIAHYWRQNFEGYELLFVNAAIIYGLYLEVVQALPSGGSSLIRKAFSAFNNKWHSQREIFDIIVGNSAIVVASIEPDKLGKVVDASSSVRTLFRTSKEGLLGSNVGMIMPSVVAAKHNGFIKKYHKNSKRGFQKTLKTYAKTLADEYFAVEINLQLSPLTNKGLNLVAHIKKMSEFESIVIVDEEGNIVEYSKNLASSLNLITKRGNLKVQSLSSDLKLANQAFNMVYKPQDILYTEKDKQDDYVIFEEELLQSPNVTTKNPFNLYSQENLLASPTRKELLLSSRENELQIKSSNRFEKIMLSEGGESNTPKINIEDTEVVNITKEEAERICKQFKEGKKVNFLPLNKRVTPGENSQITCTTEIEPLIIESKLFKVLKLKGLIPSQDAEKALSFEPPTSSIFQSQSAVVVKSVAETHDPEDDAFANQFPDEIERTLSSVNNDDPLGDNEKGDQETAKKTLTRKTIQTQGQALSFDPSELNIVKNNSDLSNPAKSRSRKAGTVAQSVIDSQATQRVTARKLNNSLKIEKQSYTARVTVFLVYLAVIIIISSICVNLIYTKKSIKDLSDSMSLISLVNTRLGKTIVLWQSLLILYARSIKLRPIDFRVPKYKAIALNATNDVINNTMRLSEELGNFADKEVVRKLYDKNVLLWEPITHKFFNDEYIDSLTAGQALLFYSGQFSGYNGSYLDLANTRGALFPLNNTANDYFIALQGTINDLSTFFTETHDTNVSLLKAITILEALFLTLPLILILGILYITVKLYAKLFKAICKIHNESLIRRISQLENISKLFNEDIEDDILYLSDFKWRDNTKNTAKLVSDKKSANKSRQFQRRGMILYGLKYTFLALIPLAIVMGLIISSLDRSTQNLKDLNTINNRLQISFQLGSNIKEVLPSWYFEIIFHNDTSFKIRNKAPKVEVLKNLEALGNANTLLLEHFTDSTGVIDDPVVADILKGNVCNHLLSNLYYDNCTQNTRGGEYGLLGLNPLYYQFTDLIRTWMKYTNPTQTQAAVLLVQWAAIVNNIHLNLYDIYDSLSNHLLEKFMETAAEKETDTLQMFYVNLSAVLVAMLLIRVVVLTRLQKLDLGIRRILRIIPYKIIEENKVMSCYLAIAFQNELKVLKQIA